MVGRTPTSGRFRNPNPHQCGMNLAEWLCPKQPQTVAATTAAPQNAPVMGIKRDPASTDTVITERKKIGTQQLLRPKECQVSTDRN